VQHVEQQAAVEKQEAFEVHDETAWVVVAATDGILCPCLTSFPMSTYLVCMLHEMRNGIGQEISNPNPDGQIISHTENHRGICSASGRGPRIRANGIGGSFTTPDMPLPLKNSSAELQSESLRFGCLCSSDLHVIRGLRSEALHWSVFNFRQSSEQGLSKV